MFGSASFSAIAAMCIRIKSSCLVLGVFVCERTVGQFFVPSVFSSSWLYCFVAACIFALALLRSLVIICE